MDKIIKVEISLNCSKDEVFKLFSTSKGLMKWLCPEAIVETKVGGKYELFWTPEDPENNSTMGCKILAIGSPNYLNFEWKGPVQFKAFMNSCDPLTNVTIIFHEEGDNTIVTLLHTGWRDTPEWDEARNYFINAWNGAFIQLNNLINK